MKAKGKNTRRSIRRNAVQLVENARIESGPHLPSMNVQVPRSIIRGTIALTKTRKEYHDEISQKTLRIAELEQALADAQRKKSSEPHPLLVKAGRESMPSLDVDTPGICTDSSAEPLQTRIDDKDELVEVFGMMSVKNNPFHSGTATSEHLIKKNACGRNRRSLDNAAVCKYPSYPLRLVPDIMLYSLQFPLPPDDQPPPRMDGFLEYLPPPQKARSLLDCYLLYFSWAAMPIPEADLDLIFQHFYPRGVRTDVIMLHDSHSLAVLFMAFGLGTLYDMEQDKSSLAMKTKEFYFLTRAALVADPVTENTTLHGVQSIMLMIWYLRLFPGIESVSFQWPLLGMLNKLLQAIGLHRDKSTLVLWPQEQRQYIPSAVERLSHEQTFWEFVSVDVWQSCMLGRSTSILMSEVDCNMPQEMTAPYDFASSFYVWKYEFSRIVSDVMARMSGTTGDMPPGKTRAKPVNYNDILELEGRLRKHSIPDDLAWPAHDEPLPRESAGRIFQRYIANIWTKVSVMYLHRQFFYLAVSENSYDPTKSKAWHSVEVAYDGAATLAYDTRRLWLAHPRIIDRMCSFWSHSHSAAVILATLVTKSPGCQFAASALQHLDTTCDWFTSASNSLQPPNALPQLRELQEKAHRIYKIFHDTSGQFTNTIHPRSAKPVLPSRAQSPFGYQFYAAPAVPTVDAEDGSGLDRATPCSSDSDTVPS